MKNKEHYTERELNLIERSFEDGYVVAKRLYKPININYVTQSDLEERETAESIARRNKKATNYKQGKIKIK